MPLDYDENLPFPDNNFIYKTILSIPATKDTFLDARLYTTTLSVEVVGVCPYH